MSPVSGLVIAVPRGALMPDSLDLLDTLGIDTSEVRENDRKLLFEDVGIVTMRPSDVATYVEAGAADIGITGKDVLTEAGDREVYELPANPPAIDELHRARVDCKRPGQSFKPQTMVGLADPDRRYDGTGDAILVGALDGGPAPAHGPLTIPKTAISAMGDDYGLGARPAIGAIPVAASDHDPVPFRGSGTNLAPKRAVAAYRDDQTDWCPPNR